MALFWLDRLLKRTSGPVGRTKARTGRPAPAARATYERAMAIARAQLGEEGFAAAWAEGEKLTLEQVIAEAKAAQVPTLAFGSHIDLEAQQAARRAGADRVISNSKLAKDLPGIVERMLSKGGAALEYEPEAEDYE